MKREVEYAIQIRTKDGYEDYSVYSRRTCLWKKPIEDWVADTITCYEYRRCCEKHRSTRLVKRVTIEEIIEQGRKGEGDGSK